MRSSRTYTAARLRACAAAALVLSVLTPFASAQSATGDVQGVVVDRSGAVLPGVTVTITDTATSATREVVTDADGRFAVPGLPVGPYEVTAALLGFATQRQPDLPVQVGQTITLRLELGVAAVADTITISGVSPAVETTRSHVSSVMNAAALANLPANGRNFIDFVLLTPGVTRDVRSGDLSFAGQRGTLNSLIVDGADNNNTFFGQALGRTGSGLAPYQFSLEAVQEFNVNANAYPAEYGRAGGAVINVVTKSGTNDLSGSAFEFYRDKSLNANTAINESVGLGKSPYHYHQFGGTVGGPFVRDRHFFFFSYDGQRSSQPNHVFLNLPSFTLPTAPTQAAIARLTPLATSWERTLNQHVFLMKTAHRLGRSQRLTLRYNHHNFIGNGLESGGAQVSREATGASHVFTGTFNATVASVVGSSLFNEARFHYAKDRERGDANSDGPQADIRESGRLVLRIGRNRFSPHEITINRLQFADTLTWVRGAHTIKSGVDLQFDDIRTLFPANFSGVYVFNSLSAFNLGIPNTYTQAFAGEGTTGPETHPDISEVSVFAQDEWRVGPALTVNAGLRYDLQKLARPEVRNLDTALAAAGIDTSSLNTDTNNLGPRLGLAWSPVGRRYVVRAGYGLSYGRTPSIMVATTHSNNGVSVRTVTSLGRIDMLTGEPVPLYPNRWTSVPEGVAPPRPTIFVFDREYQNARVQQGSAGFEWEWMPHTSLAVNYLFVNGNQLPRSTDINIGPATATTLIVADASGNPTGSTVAHYRFATGPFTNFSRVVSFQSTADSKYNSLTFELNRRFAQNHQYRIAYTLGKVEDTVPDATAVPFSIAARPVVGPEGSDDRKFASNPGDVDADRAPGNNDQRHRFVVSLIYSTNGVADGFDGLARSLLKGWTLSAIYTAQSGQPYSAYATGDINRDNNFLNDIAPGTVRNQYRLPVSISLDPRVARDMPLSRQARLTLIWEAFNLLNRANYNAVNNTLYSQVGTPDLRVNPLFGQRTGQTDPRIMQLAAKVSF